MHRLDTQIRQLESVIETKRSQLVQLDSSISKLLVSSHQIQKRIKLAKRESRKNGLEGVETVSLVQSWTLRKSNLESSLQTLNAYRSKTVEELDMSVRNLDMLFLRRSSKSQS